ncbi:hypothetical protein Plec18167_009257 [Paecilomyces lecythidis]|uniref:F-box domain-containing protein n=1 Tax=Paecilomyces lecythidis TaxID=3004212 RepID=A0ABR3WQJ0_9EURO
MSSRLSQHSGLMISTLPPPRPVSVNSLARAPATPPLPFQKTSRSTSADIQIHDGPDLSVLSNPHVQCHGVSDTEMSDSQLAPVEEPRSPQRFELRFENLPIEIHDAILDHLFGERASTLTTTTPGKSSARSWSKALRHPRRKALSNLALISPVWRPLVQDRIYRHIKVKGTTDALAECGQWFRDHPHLVSYVRHIEVWVPVWGNRTAKNASPHLPPSRRYNNEDTGLADVAAVLQATMAGWDDSDTNMNGGSSSNYHYASHNATLEEIFNHVNTFFPEARILTLEGGHCKKPPMIRHFRNDPSGKSGSEHLAVLPNIQTFVMRGAWNIMREYRHWCNLAEALPSLREWHCAYAKPKIEGYDTIAKVLMNMPATLMHVNISLEGFYNKEGSQHNWFGDSPSEQHLCRLLGRVAPQLESLTFTGKVCACFFSTARSLMANKQAQSKLKSLDLVVKTCCRDRRADPASPLLDDASGITNLKFIQSFENVIVGAVRALDTLLQLEYIRIRFIDLDSACPLLNPYFHLVNNQCSGLWSETILETLHEVRPKAYFVELADGIYPQYGPNHQIVGAIYPRTRPLSIRASAYKIIADASKA